LSSILTATYYGIYWMTLDLIPPLFCYLFPRFVSLILYVS
jgi:hypothetical protein